MTYTQCERCHTYLDSSDLITQPSSDRSRDVRCHRCGHTHRLDWMEWHESLAAILERDRRLREKGIMPWDTSKRTAEVNRIRKEVERDAIASAKADVQERRSMVDAGPEWQEKRARLREEAERRIAEKTRTEEPEELESEPVPEPLPETIAKPVIKIRGGTLDAWM